MTRAVLIVLDSVGIGGAPDADQYFNGTTPDTGANTLGHIAEHGVSLPHMAALGLGRALSLSSGTSLGVDGEVAGFWGAATEVSRGKDTPSGHWELAGVPVPWDWHVFPDETPAFPKHLSDLTANLAQTDGILGNCRASGTEIISRLGEEHMRTGRPICYTSADSVFQIAAHEEAFGLERLLQLCKDLAPTLHDMRVGRVIARPFVGSPGAFLRTGNRRDFALSPPFPTLCDWVQNAGQNVHAIGKIGDIFSMRGIDTVAKGTDRELMEHLIDAMKNADDGALIFANFVEFDSLFGHRRDVSGYAQALEWFDAQIPRLQEASRPGDLVLLTADHGNDPTWVGTDHTRERVPVIGWGITKNEIGHVAFADVAATVAAHLSVPSDGPGRSFL